ncbi:MAG: hypothetical protein ACOZQL_01990 [Myxococcota bacterium]
MTFDFSIARPVREAARAGGIALTQCPADLQEKWRSSLLTTLHLSKLDELWADGVWESGIQTNEPWKWIARLRGCGPFVIFFPSNESTVVFLARTAIDAATILDLVNVAAFDFAVSRLVGDFALSKYGEGGLRAFGAVTPWINEDNDALLDLDSCTEQKPR